jgi:hypothetical protein
MSTRFLFVPTPWQLIYQAIYAAYVGTIAESAIIDIDHWRHYFLILGLLWGLRAASRQYVAAAPIAPPRSGQPLPERRPLAASWSASWSCARCRASVHLRRIGGA